VAVAALQTGLASKSQRRAPCARPGDVQPGTASPAAVLALQRAAGNRATLAALGRGPRRRSLQRTPEAPEGTSSCQIHFKVNTTEVVDPKERDECLERARQYVKQGDRPTVKLHGYASEEGPKGWNEGLAQRRADKVKSLLEKKGISTGYVRAIGHGPDKTFPDLAPNRRVDVYLSEFLDYEGDDPIEVAPFKCGPDVTQQVHDAIKLTRSTFAGWSDDEKDESCEHLTSVRYGAIAWDIVDLHNNAWILDYRPLCATEKGTPPCGSTVEVDDECYYAGSANYVIFGTMCRLCYDHFKAQGRAGSMPGYTGWMDFTEKAMVDLIDLYKSSSANVGPSKAWAIAGRDEWPHAGKPPKGDRPKCAPDCVEPYHGSPFRVNWHPHMWHT
jgi:outer membrane protein OmpA-like peptidoglycan-associated protein